MKKLLSASEVAALNLAGLPRTKVAIAARAEREGWYSETKTGLGGTRRVYEVPARYLTAAGDESASQPTEADAVQASPVVAGTIQPGPAGVDLALVKFADEVLEQWLQNNGLILKPERRAAVLAVLIDYLSKGASRDDLINMMKAMAT